MRVYPFGYSVPGAQRHLDALMQDESMLLIDTRFSPRSMRPEWRQEALQAKYGKRYHWAGRFLGNKNFKGGDIVLVNPDEGIRGLRMYLDEGHSLVLLCACANYETCHRKKIIELLQQAEPEVEVVYPDTTAVQEDSIMCLSVRQPYADWLVHPQKFMANGIIPKTIENREWSTSYRGPLLIHASKSFEQDAFQYWLHQCPELGNGNLWDVASPEKKDYVLGAIVGLAELVDVVEDCPYTQWILEGDWTEEEQQAVEDVLKVHMGELTPLLRKYPDNQWRVTKHQNNLFTATRSTWQSGSFVGPLQEVVGKIEQYYA